MHAHVCMHIHANTHKYLQVGMYGKLMGDIILSLSHENLKILRVDELIIKSHTSHAL